MRKSVLVLTSIGILIAMAVGLYVAVAPKPDPDLAVTFDDYKTLDPHAAQKAEESIKSDQKTFTFGPGTSDIEISYSPKGAISGQIKILRSQSVARRGSTHLFVRFDKNMKMVEGNVGWDASER